MSSGPSQAKFQVYDCLKGSARSDAHSKDSKRVLRDLSIELRLVPELLTTRHELLLL